MLPLANWIASVATVGGALMTGANLGTRVTGWGFAVFAVGSLAWVITGLQGDDPSLVVTDGILLLVNLFAVWRWLGRQSRYEDSSAHAAARSRGAPVPTLFPAGSLVGASIKGPDDATRGVVAEAMLNCDDKSLAYVVVGEGGVAGAGETLRVLAPDALRLHGDTVRCDLTDAEWRALPTTEHRRWPTAPPKDAGRAVAAHDRR
jgi:hypothetical protein